MDGRDISGYKPGRGLPSYLLTRNYGDSSTDSDGASRIFATSSYSNTPDENSESSFVLQISRTFSLHEYVFQFHVVRYSCDFYGAKHISVWNK